MGIPLIVLLDTNVLLDVIEMRAPHDTPALALWSLSEKRRVSGFVSAITFNNVFYIVRRKVGRENALQAIRQIRAVFEIAELSASVIDHALTLSMPDFEDAIHAATAKAISAELIVSRN